MFDTKKMIRSKTKGFTLIELMIVVAIIGILAAIAIPKFAQMLEKSREGATKGTLGSLKSASSIYYGDQQGIWPTTLNTFSVYSFSKYMDNISSVKVTGAFVAASPSPVGNIVTLTSEGHAPTAGATGWLYDSTNGTIYVNSTVKDSKTIPYSFYGFE
jgi:prepilin-type N-terminal cleavage/methylation domain-containing protein